MILMSDELRAWGHTATTQYTHPPRSVVMQVSLAGRMDFTEKEPPRQTLLDDPLVRANAFFMSFVAGGVDIDVWDVPPFGPAQFRANHLTEVRAAILAENCGADAVFSQFDLRPTIPSANSVDATLESRMVAFILPINGTIKFKHIVKVFAGGRAVSEQEAVDVARSYAKRFSIDVTPLKMIVTTDVEHDARAQRMDVKTGEFISSRLL